jgi:hypothetical protein
MTTTPLAVPALTTALGTYRTRLRDLSDTELAAQASKVAALPGVVADELRRLVDAEYEYRQTVRRQDQQHHGEVVVFRPPATGPAFRDLFATPPNARVDDGLYCPLDDTVLVRTRPAGLACPECLAAWAVDGRDGRWVKAVPGVPRTATGRATRVAGIAAAVLAAPGAATVLTGREYADAIGVPDQAVWAAAVAVLGVSAGVAVTRITQWMRDRRHLAVDIPDEDLDPAALALLNRVRAARRAHGEVV